jgi:hypothetical protein
LNVQHGDMLFVPDWFVVPSGLATGEFVLEPLTVEHVELDLEALMSSREMLREWSGTTWPSDEFTLAENQEDLERHDAEHRAREAFTYTVLDPVRARCLGCVYVTPLKWNAEVNRGVLDGVGDDEAVVGFWVVEERLADGLDRRLLAALSRWLSEEWAFSSASFATALAHTHQVDLFTAAGLRRRAEISVRNREGVFGLWW